MKLVRVTEVISPWSGLDKIPEATLQYAALRGTLVHEYCSIVAEGGFLVNIDAECRPYVESFRDWFNRMVDEVILSEHRMNDETFCFTGQIDLLVKLKEGPVLLADIKTPITKNKTWPLQCAAYHHLCELHGYHPDKIGCLQLSPEGKPAKLNYYENPAQYFNLFLQALNLYKYFQKG
jgi:hypothetical protein